VAAQRRPNVDKLPGDSDERRPPPASRRAGKSMPNISDAFARPSHGTAEAAMRGTVSPSPSDMYDVA